MDFSSWKEVPREIKDKTQWRFSVSNAHTGRIQLQGYARQIKEDSAYSLTIYDAVIDISERHEGILLNERWSYHPEFNIGGSITWAYRPIQLIEREGDSKHVKTA